MCVVTPTDYWRPEPITPNAANAGFSVVVFDVQFLSAWLVTLREGVVW